MSTILGLALIITSIYFLGQNIIFTSHYYSSWWQETPAAASVLALLAGICSLTCWRQTMGNWGWILIAIGIVLVFVSGGVVLQPTSLWTFFVSMLGFTSGYQLLTKGRIRF
jgi:hypothetical protein